MMETKQRLQTLLGRLMGLEGCPLVETSLQHRAGSLQIPQPLGQPVLVTGGHQYFRSFGGHLVMTTGL